MESRRLLVPKTDYSFNGVASSTQEVQLVKLISMEGIVSGLLEVRVYSRSLASQTIGFVLQAMSPAEDDPSAIFTTSTGEIAATISSGAPTAVPGLITTALTAPVPAYFRLIVRAVQASTPTVMTATASVSLLGRDA